MDILSQDPFNQMILLQLKIEKEEKQIDDNEKLINTMREKINQLENEIETEFKSRLCKIQIILPYVVIALNQNHNLQTKIWNLLCKHLEQIISLANDDSVDESTQQIWQELKSLYESSGNSQLVTPN